jgi:hypothetical protein
MNETGTALLCPGEITCVIDDGDQLITGWLATLDDDANCRGAFVPFGATVFELEVDAAVTSPYTGGAGAIFEGVAGADEGHSSTMPTMATSATPRLSANTSRLRRPS